MRFESLTFNTTVQSITLPAALIQLISNNNPFTVYLNLLVAYTLMHSCMHGHFGWHLCLSGILVEKQ